MVESQSNVSAPICLPRKQKGVVLIVSLVFLIALTAVAAAMMQNTSTDMKMSGASQAKLIATQETLSEMDEIIYNQVRKVDGTNRFTSALPLFPINPSVNQPSHIPEPTQNSLLLEDQVGHSAPDRQLQHFE